MSSSIGSVCSAGLISILTLFARRHLSRSDDSSGVAALSVRDDQEAVLSRSAGNHEPIFGEARVGLIMGKRIVKDGSASLKATPWSLMFQAP
jgi:hypothetical protein